MEGDGGGGGGAGFRYGNLQNNPPLYRPSPPLTAIDRFLRGTQNKQAAAGGSPNGLCDFSPSSGAIGGYGGGVSWPNIRNDMCFPDGVFLEGENSSWMHERNPNVGFKEEKNLRKAGKKVKGIATCPTLIKGQWTEEEDRKLIKMVKQYGERKWAQIAEKLVGRAGKQCRERWHNHLRPDIKKDVWSEEEERLLIEAHQKVGNRWAEIRKRIPGRTENAIKNHFNATKRRQNSRRKSKQLVQGQQSGEKSQSSILQNYIQSKNLMINDTCTTTKNTTSTTPTLTGSSLTGGSSLSEDPINQMNVYLFEISESITTDNSTPLLINTHSYDDELLFMQNFFAKSYNTEPCVDNIEIWNNHSLGLYQSNMAVNQQEDENCAISSSTLNSNMYIKNYPKLEEAAPTLDTTTHLYSDLYVSYLLNGGASTSSSRMDHYYDNMKLDLLTTAQASANGRKEMDLIEMISSSQFSQGSSTTSF